MADTKEDYEGGRTSEERARYHLDRVFQEMEELRHEVAIGRRNIEAFRQYRRNATDPDLIFPRQMEMIRPLLGESYMGVNYNGIISIVTDGALAVTGLTRKRLEGKDYSTFLDENELPQDAEIPRSDGERIIMIEGNKRIVRLGAPIEIISSAPGDQRIYGSAIIVYEGPAIPPEKKRWWAVWRSDKEIAKRTKKNNG